LNLSTPMTNRREFGPNAARVTLGFLLLSAGLFISGTAFLPSSTSMYLTMLSYGAWYNRDFKLAVFFTAMSAFLSWPFAALIGEIALNQKKKLPVSLHSPKPSTHF
jgi:alpha-1,2-mannosyltransferase